MGLTRVRALVPLLLLALLAAPLAAADHVFSHRVYVVGRVVDAEGAPVSGQPVRVEFEGFAAGGLCLGRADEPTGPQGDFRVCRHAHRLPEDVTAVVTVAGATARAPLDPLTRHAVAQVRLDGPAPGVDLDGWRTFNRTLLVAGRAYDRLPEPVEAEGVPVNATPRTGANVTARLVAGDRELARGEGRVDDVGAFQVALEADEVPEGARVRVEVGQHQAATEVDPLFRRADVAVVRDLRAPTGPGPDAPGSQTPAPPAWMALAALALTAAAAGARRARRPRR